MQGQTMVNPWWAALTVWGVVNGVNLLQAAFTGFCPLAKTLKRLGARPGVAFD